MSHANEKEDCRKRKKEDVYEVMVHFPQNKQALIARYKPFVPFAKKNESGSPPVTSIRIHGLLAEKESSCYIFCGVLNSDDDGTSEVCIKLISPVTDFTSEFESVLRLANDERVAFLLPELHGFIRMKYEGQMWGGMVMQHVPYCVNSLIFPTATTPDSLRRLDAAMASFSSSCGSVDHHQHGLAVEKEGDDARTCIIATCMRALGIMHDAGWVHGDTHMGNFLLDHKTWRVYLIDFQRAFRSTDKLQQFLDVQELVGHASGLLMADPQRSLSWDLLNVPGVMSLRTHMAEDLLPVCVCFACPTKSERGEGCKRCLSAYMRDKAAAYAEDREAYLAALHEFTLAELQAEVERKRSVAKAELALVADELMREIPRLMLSEKKLPAAFFERGFQNLETDEALRGKFREAVADMLYSGAIAEDGHADGVAMIRVLDDAGSSAAARLLEAHIRRMK